MTEGAIFLTVLFAMMASFIQRVTGFGFGIFIMTMLPYLMPSYAEATTLSGILAIVGTLVTWIQLRRHTEWRKLIPILLTFIIVSYLSVLLVARIDGKTLKHILGAILILVSIYFFFVSGKIRLKPTVPLQVGLGTLSGLMGGLFAMQGPPAVIYFISCTDRKESYTAMTAAYFVVGNLMITAFRAHNGFLTPAVWHAALLGVPAVLAGMWIGSKVYERIPIEKLKMIIYAFLAMSGVLALLS